MDICINGLKETTISIKSNIEQSGLEGGGIIQNGGASLTSNINYNSNYNSNFTKQSSKSNFSNYNSNLNSNNSSLYPIKKKIKQLENALSQKVINLNDLKTLAWKGIPFGKRLLII